MGRLRAILSHWKRRPRGFTITTALIGIVVATIGAMAMMQFISNNLKAQRNVQNSIDFDIIKNDINALLQSGNACAGSFRDDVNPAQASDFDTTAWPAPPAIPAPGWPIDSIRVGAAGAQIVRLNDTIPGRLRITRLHWTSATPDGTITNGGITYRKYLATLRIEATKAAGSVGGTNLASDVIVPIFVNVASGRIEQCGKWNAVPAQCSFVGTRCACSFDEVDPGGGAQDIRSTVMYCTSCIGGVLRTGISVDLSNGSERRDCTGADAIAPPVMN